MVSRSLHQMSLSLFLFALAAHITPAAANGRFLKSNLSSSPVMDAKSAKVFQDEIRHAVKTALGCGGAVDQDRVTLTLERLLPMWYALPKNSFDRVDRRAFRYLGHRYFMRYFGISVRGFEPMRILNQSQGGNADMLSQQFASYVEATLESHHVAVHGFSIEDVVHMIVMLEQLIFDVESSLLEHIFTEQKKSTQQMYTFSEVKTVLDSYLIHWIVGDDIHSDGPTSEFHNAKFLATDAHDLFPEWTSLSDFVKGQILTFFWKRQHAPSKSHSKDFWSAKFSFDDVHTIVKGVTGSFASFWASECRAMKEVLVGLDVHATGRVASTKFYAATIHQQQRFSESPAYLREIGALDETSSIWKKQVIIPNYVQSPANCIVSTPHYMVCCSNECETILGEIESALESPTASPEEVLTVVSDLTVQSTLDDDGPLEWTFQLAEGLISQLEHIASGSGGLVHLHGRLFSQWLHYAFPRECPFPHKTGEVAYMTPREYGNVSVESWENMQEQAVDPLDGFALASLDSMSKDDIEWMTQWSAEEELVAEVGWPLPPAHNTMKLGLGETCAVLLFVGVLGGLFHKGLWELGAPALTRSLYV